MGETNITRKKLTRHLKCKLDGHDFDCDNNKSGCCTSYILNLGIENAKYECKNNFNKYFELIEEEKDFLYCPLCDYETKDSTNKSGVFTNHIKNKHKMDINKFLEKYPDYKVLYPTHLMKEGVKKLNEDVGIVCQICGKKFRKLTETHLAKHNIKPNEYKLKYGISTTCSQHTENIQRNKSFTRQIDQVFDRIIKSGFTPLFSKEEYYGVNDKFRYKFKCNTCGNIFEDNLDDGNIPICRICNPKDKFEPNRKLEHEIQDFLFNECNIKDLNINNRSIITPKEIDFVILSHKLGIEINGLYWHSEKYGKDRNYHINKTLECNKKGYRLIQIFEDEWNYKKDIIKSKIKHILNINTNIKSIYARNCEIKLISNKDKIDFLNNNHIQGNDNYNTEINIGGYYNNELISVMTFCKPRRLLGYKDNSDTFELSRFAVDINKRMVGIFGKLFNYVLDIIKSKYSDIKEIVTYADLRFTDLRKNIYTNNNFEYVLLTKPNYYYVKGNLRHSRYKFQKYKLIKEGEDPSLTEQQIMKNRGYYQIFDCGNIKYRYLIK